MRALLLHERRLIRNALLTRQIALKQLDCCVHEEFYPPPRLRSKIRFNNDFLLRLNGLTVGHDKECFGVGVLPHTTGVDLFLTLNRLTNEPLMVELLGGEGLPMRFFRDQLEVLSNSLSAAAPGITIDSMQYLRVLVIGGEICFFAATFDWWGELGSNWEAICQNPECELARLYLPSKGVCVDGWIRHHVPDSASTLEVWPT